MLKGRFFRNLDWVLLGTVLLLVALGILVLFSISVKASGAAPFDARNQVIFALLGLVVLVSMARIDYRAWAKQAAWLYGLAILLLVLVFILGKTALGATRWINLGFFQFQPSELAKLALIVVLAKFYAQHYEQLARPRYLLISLAYLLVPMALVLIQPDLGTALVLLFIWLVMTLVTPVRKLYLLGLIGASMALLPVVTRFLKPYQRQRLQSFFNPLADPAGAGYNVTQSTIAVGSGQLTGRGLSSGSQSQLNFLPSQHTDFVFAALAEKMGFFGAGLVLLLFGLLLVRSITIAYRAQDRFGLFVAIGISAMLLFHFLVNVGMNLGIMPVTGIPLPFISYGGTSLLVGMAAIGLLQSIAIRRKKIQFGL